MVLEVLLQQEANYENRERVMKRHVVITRKTSQAQKKEKRAYTLTWCKPSVGPLAISTAMCDAAAVQKDEEDIFKNDIFFRRQGLDHELWTNAIHTPHHHQYSFSSFFSAQRLRDL
jgi:hypothetical protein